MAIERVRGQRQVVLVQLDQSLVEPHRVLEQHVVVDHPVADEQRPRETFGELDGG